MSKPFRIYILFLTFMAFIGFKNGQEFKGNRVVASDCTEIAKSIMRKSPPTSSELKHYRFKNSIWSKILTARDFEQFDENEYFRFLEIYSNPNGQQNDLLAINPGSIEQKLALIEAIELKFSRFQNLPSVQDEIQNLNTYKLKKLQKLMQKFDLSSKITRENLEEFASDFFLILKGPPVSLLDYFVKNKSTLMNKRMFRVLEEDMLIRGLKGSMERIALKENITQIEKARVYIKNIMKYKVWRFMAIPYDLPWIDRMHISDELLEKILMDGLSQHETELIALFKKQNLIDHYERFRKVYRPVAFGVGFYFYYEKYQKQLITVQEENEETTNQNAKAKFLVDIKKLTQAIGTSDTNEKTDEELKEIQFQRVLGKFKALHHEDPSIEEYNELHRKIFD